MLLFPLAQCRSDVGRGDLDQFPSRGRSAFSRKVVEGFLSLSRGAYYKPEEAKVARFVPSFQSEFQFDCGGKFPAEFPLGISPSRMNLQTLMEGRRLAHRCAVPLPLPSSPCPGYSPVLKGFARTMPFTAAAAFKCFDHFLLLDGWVVVARLLGWACGAASQQTPRLDSNNN